MFIAISFFVFSILFYVFGLTLSIFIVAGLGYYTKARGDYVHSLFWVNKVGLLELLTVLKQCRSKNLLNHKDIIPASLVFLLAQLLIIAIPSGAQYFFKESLQGVPAGTQLFKSYQFMPNANNAGSLAMAGWSTSLVYDSDVEDGLTTMLNRTRNLPGYENGAMFTPKKYPYEVACATVDFSTGSRHASDYPNWWIPNNGCAVFSVFYLSAFDANHTLSRSVPKPGDQGRARITMQGTNSFVNVSYSDAGYSEAEVNTLVDISFGQDLQCGTGSFHSNMVVYNSTGLTSAPETVATKCLFATGEAISVSYSSVNFAVPDLASFANVSASVFQNPNELVQAMQDSIDDGTLTNFTTDPMSGVSVLEVKISNGTNVDVMMCNSRRNLATNLPGNEGVGNIYLACSYTSASAIISKSQSMLPEIVALRGPNKPFPVQANLTTTIILNHLPRSSATKDTVYFMTGILSASEITAKYLADLGQNFFIDWSNAGLYIVFDKYLLKQGYETPDWLFYFVTCFAVLGTVLGLLARHHLDYRFKGSLFWVISEEIFGPEAGQRLMQFLPEEGMFEGIPIVSMDIYADDSRNNNNSSSSSSSNHNRSHTLGDGANDIEMSEHNGSQSTESLL